MERASGRARAPSGAPRVIPVPRPAAGCCRAHATAQEPRLREVETHTRHHAAIGRVSVPTRAWLKTSMSFRFSPKIKNKSKVSRNAEINRKDTHAPGTPRTRHSVTQSGEKQKVPGEHPRRGGSRYGPGERGGLREGTPGLSWDRKEQEAAGGVAGGASADQGRENVSEKQAVYAAGAQGTCVRVEREKPEDRPNPLPTACSPPCSDRGPKASEKDRGAPRPGFKKKHSGHHQECPKGTIGEKTQGNQCH